jgi:hypothetical protein
MAVTAAGEIACCEQAKQSPAISQVICLMGIASLRLQ